MQFEKLRLNAVQVIFGHLLNPVWHSRLRRRKLRGAVAAAAVDRYLGKYAEAFAAIAPAPFVPPAPEKIYTLWFQGEKNAPAVVKSCIESMRRNSAMEVEVLDIDSVLQKIHLPSYVIDKWKNGKIRHAHFADICRLALLYEHGGVWMDATDFLGAPIPDDIMREPFFVYMAEGIQRGSYSFVQNCFIRAQKGNALVGGWLDAVLEYWKRENGTVDYFIHQLIFKKLTDCNQEMAKLLSLMPKRSQDPTHVLWFEKGGDPFDKEAFDKIISGAAFQKTEYKSKLATNPPAGSYAEAVVRFREDTGIEN